MDLLRMVNAKNLKKQENRLANESGSKEYDYAYVLLNVIKDEYSNNIFLCELCGEVYYSLKHEECCPKCT